MLNTIHKQHNKVTSDSQLNIDDCPLDTKQEIIDTIAHIPPNHTKRLKISKKKTKQEFTFEIKKGLTRFGRAKRKCLSNGSGHVFIEHWIPEVSNGIDLIRKCPGCQQSIPHPNKIDQWSSCIIRTKWSELWDITHIQKNYTTIDGIIYKKLPLPINHYSAYQTANRESQIEECNFTGTIHIEERDIEIIKHSIAEGNTRETIIMAFNTIKEYQKSNNTDATTIYTDGSLTIKEHNNATMGFGWTTATFPTAEVKGRIENWPSSTRPELAAIWTAILAVPTQTKLRIKTDSQAAIDSIEEGLSITNRKKWLKKNNSCIVRNICSLVRNKDISLELVKVKGHSGIEGNERADTLAKEGGRLDEIIDISAQLLDVIPFRPAWNDIPIEQNIRKFIKTSN
jgi:ribonuclease HI